MLCVRLVKSSTMLCVLTMQCIVTAFACSCEQCCQNFRVSCVGTKLLPGTLAPIHYGSLAPPPIGHTSVKARLDRRSPEGCIGGVATQTMRSGVDRNVAASCVWAACSCDISKNSAPASHAPACRCRTSCINNPISVHARVNPCVCSVQNT